MRGCEAPIGAMRLLSDGGFEYHRILRISREISGWRDFHFPAGTRGSELEVGDRQTNGGFVSGEK